MDRPLLALTRRPAAGEGARRAVTAESAGQLVQLRWIAVGGQLATIAAVRFGLGMPLPMLPMLGVVALLALANLIGGTIRPRHDVTNAALLLALLLDMGALTALLYLSGGATNPFIALYLLQVVLGAILLDVWSAWILAAMAVLCFAGLAYDHRPLVYTAALAPHVAGLNILGAGLSFALTATLLTLFVTRITRTLRARDRGLADLRQQTAEEEGIVRMGLFASGAAHELGTPLASLSVILSDWQRMPRLAGDPELAIDLEEMRAEVERCKAIVTDILHSAGQPRAEPLTNVAATAFLDTVVEAWRPTHAAVPLYYWCDGLEGATVAAGQSLRQAICNLLDNAAEASPDFVRLHAARGPDGLVVAVLDEGPGFAPDQLADVGQLARSRKGAGHGVGLFLAANVARRLGGQLEAVNRAEGGAEVRIVLPLAPERRSA